MLFCSSVSVDLSHEEMHDYTDPKFEKAGHKLLPSFGLCQVFTTARDIKTEVKNVHTYICELSQHVLYQYILIIMWYMFVFGIIISVLGLIQHGMKQAMAFLAMGNQEEEVKNIYQKVSVREKEYLEFIRRKNLPIFSAVLKKVNEINVDNRRYSVRIWLLLRTVWFHNYFDKISSCSCLIIMPNSLRHYCIKSARIRVFTDPYSPLRFCPYMGEYGWVNIRILAYFTQCLFLKGSVFWDISVMVTNCFEILNDMWYDAISSKVGSLSGFVMPLGEVDSKTHDL